MILNFLQSFFEPVIQKQASTLPSYNPIQQPEVLQDQSLHGACSARFASFEYRLAKVEVDLVESEHVLYPKRQGERDRVG